MGRDVIGIKQSTEEGWVHAHVGNILIDGECALRRINGREAANASVSYYYY